MVLRGVRERCGGLLRSTDGESGVFPKLVVRFSERWFVDPREERELVVASTEGKLCVDLRYLTD